MKRLVATAFLVGMGSASMWWASSVSAAGDQHAYFDALVRRADHWKSYSLRDPRQLDFRRNGGYSDASLDDGLWVTYDTANDTDPHRQDAAKVIVPPFRKWTTILAGISGGDTTILLPTPFSQSPYVPGRAVRVDNEIMTVTGSNATAITVTRGTYGTAPAAHGPGAALAISNNSLIGQIRLPLNTTDGHTYLFTWDGYWTDSYLKTNLDNHKAFQFASGGSTGSIWLEPQTNFANTWGRAACYNPNTVVAAFTTRSYNTVPAGADWGSTDGNRVGPGTMAVEPLGPKTGDFCIMPNTWTRFWFQIQQVANDYDVVSAWLADETTGPVQVLRNLKISVRTNGATANTISQFWLEYNTSTDEFKRGDMRNLVSYFRNFVALRDAGDPTGLLVRPVPGLEPAAGPTAPKNVRIYRGS